MLKTMMKAASLLRPLSDQILSFSSSPWIKILVSTIIMPVFKNWAYKVRIITENYESDSFGQTDVVGGFGLVLFLVGQNSQHHSEDRVDHRDEEGDDDRDDSLNGHIAKVVVVVHLEVLEPSDRGETQAEKQNTQEPGDESPPEELG